MLWNLQHKALTSTMVFSPQLSLKE